MSTARRYPVRGGVGVFRRQRGFTLLEVLSAFVVFALSLTMVLEIISLSVRNTGLAEDYTEVALLAQSKLDMLGVEEPLVIGQDSGEFADGLYRWNLDVSPYEEAEGEFLLAEDVDAIELLKADLEVLWGDPPRERSARFSTLRATPVERDQ